MVEFHRSANRSTTKQEERERPRVNKKPSEIRGNKRTGKERKNGTEDRKGQDRGREKTSVVYRSDRQSSYLALRRVLLLTVLISTITARISCLQRTPPNIFSDISATTPNDKNGFANLARGSNRGRGHPSKTPSTTYRAINKRKTALKVAVCNSHDHK